MLLKAMVIFIFMAFSFARPREGDDEIALGSKRGSCELPKCKPQEEMHMGVLDIIRADDAQTANDTRIAVLVDVLKRLEGLKPSYKGHAGVLRINIVTLRSIIEDGMVCRNMVDRWTSYLGTVEVES